MAMPRCAGGRPVTSRPSISTWPPLADSRPAMMRSVVDLPQPEGPSSTQKLPAAMSRSMSARATESPQRLWMPRNWIEDIGGV